MRAGWKSLVLTMILPPTLAWAQERQVAVMPFQVASVAAPDARRVEDSVRAAVAQALAGSGLRVTPPEELEQQRQAMPGCAPGACDLEVARRAGAQAFLSAELVGQEGKLFLTLRLFEASEGQLLVRASCDAASAEALVAEAGRSGQSVARELRALDAAAVQAMQVAEAPPSPAPVARPRSAVVVRQGTRALEPQDPAWKVVSLAAAGAAPVVALAFLGAPLLWVPGINLVAGVLWLTHPFLAAGAAWLVVNRFLERRLPLLQVVAAGGGVEALACLACAGPAVVLATPVNLVVAPGFVAALALANAVTVAFTANRLGRARVSGEPELSWDFTSVPPAPLEDVRQAVDDDNVVDGWAAVPPAAEPVRPRAYRLVPRAAGQPAPAPEPALHPAAAMALGPEPAGPRGQGVTDDDVARVMRAATPGFNACYENALERNPKAQGRVELSFTVTATGKVQAVHVERNEFQDAEMERCVVARFRRLVFPPALDGGWDGTFPLVFVPRDG